MTLIEQLREAIRQTLEQRDTHQGTIDSIVSGAEQRGDGGLTPEEMTRLQDARAAARGLDATIDERRAALAELEEDARRSALAASVRPAGGAVVRNEERTYREDLTRSHKLSFVADAWKWHTRSDPNCIARIERHMQESEKEYRDVQTSVFNGLIPPKYMLDQAAELARAGRPFADVLPNYGLPADGMTLYATRVTTGTAADVQTELGTVAETDMVTTDIVIPVVTVAGQQDLSRQAIERGSVTDQLVINDLVGAYAERLDLQLIIGTGANGQHRGILNVAGIASQAYAVLTVSTFISKVAGMLNDVATNRKRPAQIIVMHPRRWHFLLAQSDSTGRPFVLPNPVLPALNPVAVGSTGASGLVGTIAGGIPILADPNVPTNQGGGTEDRVFVTRVTDHALWEDRGGPMIFTFEQAVAPPTAIRIAIWGYSGFTAGRYPSATSYLAGTGLVPPTF